MQLYQMIQNRTEVQTAKHQIFRRRH